MSDEDLRARMTAATKECDWIVRDLEIARRSQSANTYGRWVALSDRLAVLRAEVLDLRNTLIRRHEREQVSSN